MEKGWRQGKKALAKTNKPLQSRGLLFEALEPRVLMSGDTIGNLVDGALAGILTGSNDAVVVEMAGVADDGGLIIDLTVNSVTEQFGSSTVGVKSIVLDGLGGDDQITVNQALAIDLNITGGSGNDTLIGPAEGAEWTIDGVTAARDRDHRLYGYRESRWRQWRRSI